MSTFRQFITEPAVNISDEAGKLKADWKTDLEAEEGEGYLPDGYSYSKVLELETIEAADLGKGYGEKLMKEFLNSPQAKSAELIFLDINPFIGKFKHLQDLSEEERLDKLERFYRKFGFRNKKRHSRMWLVIKGEIPIDELPT